MPGTHNRAYRNSAIANLVFWFLFFRLSTVGSRDTTQTVKCLSHKHENLSLGSPRLTYKARWYKEIGVVVQFSNTGAGGANPSRSLGFTG